jgi:hypothetical protein
MKKVNSYDIHDAQEWSCIIYHALAENEEQVKELAKEAGFDIEGCEIELMRTDVRDELRRPYSPRIVDALVY